MNDYGVLLWIIGSGIVMCLFALVGGVTFLLKDETLKKILLPLVAFSAGSLIGGSFFHMIPEAIEAAGNSNVNVYLYVVIGFTFFLLLEQFLHWHHCHRDSGTCRKPLNYLILVGDGIHNFIGGIAIAGTFLIDIRVGIATWLAAVAHEIPQELGDFGILVYGGWSRKKALLYNLLSASPFLLGGILAFYIPLHAQVNYLIPIAAGNFLYIGASDLVPEVNHHRSLKISLLHAACFLAGVALLFLLRIYSHH